MHRPTELVRFVSGGLFDRQQDVMRTGIEDRVNRVEPQAIDMEISDPISDVLQHEGAHAVATRLIEVDRGTPRRVIVVGEVRAELSEVISFRAEMVVDHI